MTQGVAPAQETEQEPPETGSARRRRVLVSVASVVVVVAAAGVALVMLSSQAQRKAPSTREAARQTTPPIRLDTLTRHRGDRLSETEEGTGDARATAVIGVGTDEFLGERSSAAVLDVDGTEKYEPIPSDEEVERHVIALERANRRIEAMLRGLGGSGVGTGRLIWPVRGPITSPFGPRGGRLHAGLDIGVSTGTPVRASDAGRVVVSGWVGGYGNYICVQHTRSLSTCYAHNSRLGVRKGDRVRKGAVIARSGSTGNSTGPHLHFETRVNGGAVNPLRFLPR
jgi:murein DD-endopeptidase MepM/ murein hydrolase activator NlpD